jgi:DNA-directed RNA polymerase specialized sigma24 family protein
MLDAALSYARRGWHVFPLHTPRTPTICSCGNRECGSIGKHPRTRHGVAEATTDEDKIRTWWGMWPDANIGIACKPSELVVLDVDPKSGGEESLAQIRQQLGDGVFETITCITGSGGQHIYYGCPPGAAVTNVVSGPRFVGPLGPGIDVRANGGLTSQHGGYVVAPPSLHASGRRYEWEAGYGPDERDLLELPEPLQEHLVVRLDTPPIDRQDKISFAVALEGIPEGERDWSLFKLACKFRALDVPIDMAMKLILEAAAKCKPPFPEAEARRKVISAYSRYAEGRFAIAGPGEEPRNEFEATPLGAYVSGEAVQDIRWVIHGHVIAGLIHIVYGEPESGKTILALRWALDVIEAGGRVVIVDEESGPAKIGGLLGDMGADPEKVDQQLRYFAFPSLDLKAWKEAAIEILEFQPQLIIMDSLTDLMANAGIDENKGAEVTQWMLGVPQMMARSPGAPAVVLIDHVTKATENTRYSVGSRAKKAKADVLWYVDKVIDFDRQTLGRVELKRHKNRPGVLEPKHVWVIGGEDDRLVCRPLDPLQDVVTTVHPREQQVLDLLRERGPMGPSEIAAEMGLHRSTVHRLLKELLRRNEIAATGETTDRKYAIAGEEQAIEGREEPDDRGLGYLDDDFVWD